MMLPVLLAIGAIGTANVALALQGDVETSTSYARLRADFPKAIRYSEKRHELQFCPDETCHVLRASRHVRREMLSDFLVLYLRYYSDYSTLSDWRHRQSTTEWVQRILTRPRFAACNAHQLPRSRCAARQMVADFGIQGWDLRFDEGHRSSHRMDLVHLVEVAP